MYNKSVENLEHGQLEMDKEKLFTLLGKSMYREDLAKATMKELFQNAFDACKGIAGGAIDVEIDSIKHSITVRDNGVGMTPDIVKSAFFTIGGSDKSHLANEDRSGGLGMAKMLFLSTCRILKLHTVRDGIATDVVTSADEILTSGFNIKTYETSESHGTQVDIVLPEEIPASNDAGVKIVDMRYANSFFNYPIILRGIKLTINGRLYESAVENYKFAGTASSSFAKFDIYIKPDTYGGSVSVLSSGIYQFRKQYREYNDAKSRMSAIVDVRPTVDTNSELYPFNNQRESFRPAINPEITDLKNVLRKINYNIDFAIAKASFTNAFSMNADGINIGSANVDTSAIADHAIEEIGDISDLREVGKTLQKFFSKEKRTSTLDTSNVVVGEMQSVVCDNLPLDKPLFHNNTNMLFSDAEISVLNEFGSLMAGLRKACVDCGSLYFSEKVYNRLCNQYWGISIDKNYAGVNVFPKLMNFLAINPLALPPCAVGDPIAFATEFVAHVIVHEFTHNAYSSHGSSFCAEMSDYAARFGAMGGAWTAFKTRLYEFFRKNYLTVEEMVIRFHSAQNNAESLEEDN